MTMQKTLEPTTTEQTLIGIVRKLPPERVSQIVDFARFIEWQTIQTDDEDELTEEASEEAILAAEAQWEAQFAASPEKLRKLAAEARADIRAGRTTEIIMTDDGRLAPG